MREHLKFTTDMHFHVSYSGSSMDRLHALRDTANLPRAIAPPIPSPHTSTSGMESSMNDSGLDMKMDDSLTDIHWLHRMDAGQFVTVCVLHVNYGSAVVL